MTSGKAGQEDQSTCVVLATGLIGDGDGEGKLERQVLKIPAQAKRPREIAGAL
jgi:hypothetical protein